MNNEEKILSMLETLMQGQAKLEAGQTETNARLDKLEDGQAKTNARLDRLEQKTDDLQLSVARIELVHGQKLDGLADGYSMAYGIACETRSDVAAMKETIDMHDTYIKFLTNKVSK